MTLPSATESSTPLRFLVFIVSFLISAPPALAVDLPARTPGLWELQITPDLSSYNLPPQRPQSARQCIDATVDQLFWRRDLGAEVVERNLCRANVGSSNGTITADFFCTVSETSLTIRMVISGDFKSSYTMDLTSTQGPIRGVAPPPVHVTTAYKYIGPCEADQRPGDFITGDGSKMHLFGDPKRHDQP